MPAYAGKESVVKVDDDKDEEERKGLPYPSFHCPYLPRTTGLV